MKAADKMNFYLSEALKKVTDKKFRRVSLALIESLPSILTTLVATIQSKESSSAERTHAMALYDRLLSRTLAAERQSRDTREADKRRAAWIETSKPPQMTTTDFSHRLCNLSNETMDELFLRLRTANQRYVKINGGLR